MKEGLNRWADPPLLVLASLAEEPKHGYAITQDIADTMGVRLSAGTLYAVISRLEARGLIEALESDDRRRRTGLRGRRQRASGAVGADAPGGLRRAAAAARQLWLGRGMIARQPGRARGAVVLARVALGLYPPAWRRYEDEVQALLEDSGAGTWAAVSLAWHAVPVWACPPRHLHDRPGRMRGSLATVAIAWALLAGLAAVFLQLAQAQGSSQALTLARHPVIQWSYWVFDGAVIISVLAVAVGVCHCGCTCSAMPAVPAARVNWRTCSCRLWCPSPISPRVPR